MRKNCSKCTRWRQESTDYGPGKNGGSKHQCRSCTNVINRRLMAKRRATAKLRGMSPPTRYKNDPDWLQIGPFRDWIEQTLIGMTTTEFQKKARITSRRLYSIRYEQAQINYYVADSILTYMNGPPIWELWPEVDDEGTSSSGTARMRENNLPQTSV